MLPTEARVGWIFRYAYLWNWQHQEGREEVVRVLPITHTPPGNPADAIEIPAAVKIRLRLDEGRSWIVLTESNRFVWPGPDTRAVGTETGYFGPLPPALFAEVKRRFVAIARGEASASSPHRSVPRSE